MGIVIVKALTETKGMTLSENERKEWKQFRNYPDKSF
jgi:hypothetical protein